MPMKNGMIVVSRATYRLLSVRRSFAKANARKGNVTSRKPDCFENIAKLIIVTRATPYANIDEEFCRFQKSWMERYSTMLMKLKTKTSRLTMTER